MNRLRIAFAVAMTALAVACVTSADLEAEVCDDTNMVCEGTANVVVNNDL